MIKIDQILKKDKSVASVAKELKSQETVSDDASSEQAVSVSELFGGVQSADEADSAIVDEDIFAERPFSSLLRSLGNSIGVPEKNTFAIKKIDRKS